MLSTNLGLNIDTLKQYTINMIEECVSICLLYTSPSPRD